MTVDIAAGSARFEIGRVVRRLIDVVGKNRTSFLVLSAVLTSPYVLFSFYNVANLYGYIQPQSLAVPGVLTTLVASAVAGLAIYIVFASQLQAAITHGMMVSLNGGKASFAECLAAGIRNALPLTATVLLAALAIGVGFVVLIVPGAILALMFSIVTPVRVTEHTGVLQTLSRSAELTKNHRASIFGLVVVFWVVAIIVGLTLRVFAGLPLVGVGGTRASMMLFVGLNGIFRVFFNLVGAAGVASVYYELRLVKEGVGPEQIAAIFE